MRASAFWKPGRCASSPRSAAPTARRGPEATRRRKTSARTRAPADSHPPGSRVHRLALRAQDAIEHVERLVAPVDHALQLLHLDIDAGQGGARLALHGQLLLRDVLVELAEQQHE